MENNESRITKLREHFDQLRNEDTVFERVMYRSTNQHRSCFYFSRLKQIRRSLRLLRTAAPDKLFSSLLSYLAPKRKNAKPKAETRDEILNSLLGTARILQEMNAPILCASRQLHQLMKQGFFLPFVLTVMSILARIRVLSQQILLDVTTFYNQVAPDLFGRTPSLQPFNKLQKELPASLECTWDETHYHLKEHKGAETWFVSDRGGNMQTSGSSAVPVYSKGFKVPLLNSCQRSRTSEQAPQKSLNVTETPRNPGKNLSSTCSKGFNTPLLNTCERSEASLEKSLNVGNVFKTPAARTSLSPVETSTPQKYGDPQKSAESQKRKREFLDFVEGTPQPLAAHNTRKRVAYTPVRVTTSAAPVSAGPAPSSTSGSKGQRMDAVLDLLLGEKKDQSLF